MSNGNCGQRESSCNPLTGVDKLGGRKQPNVRRPSDGSILGDDWREEEGEEVGAGDPADSSGACGDTLQADCWRSCRSSAGEREGLAMGCLYGGAVNSKNSFLMLGAPGEFVQRVRRAPRMCIPETATWFEMKPAAFMP